jgi:hypothetical protein
MLDMIKNLFRKKIVITKEIIHGKNIIVFENKVSNNELELFKARLNELYKSKNKNSILVTVGKLKIYELKE